MTRVWLTPSLSAAATAPLPTQFLALDPIFQTCSDLEACDGWLADQVPSTGAITSHGSPLRREVGPLGLDGTQACKIQPPLRLHRSEHPAHLPGLLHINGGQEGHSAARWPTGDVGAAGQPSLVSSRTCPLILRPAPLGSRLCAWEAKPLAQGHPDGKWHTVPWHQKKVRGRYRPRRSADAGSDQSRTDGPDVSHGGKPRHQERGLLPSGPPQGRAGRCRHFPGPGHFNMPPGG